MTSWRSTHIWYTSGEAQGVGADCDTRRVTLPTAQVPPTKGCGACKEQRWVCAGGSYTQRWRWYGWLKRGDMWVSGFKYKIFLGDGFLRYGRVSSRQQFLFVAIVFLSLKNAIETIKYIVFKPQAAHLRKASCTRNEMLKYDLLDSQSWLRCPPTCVGQGVATNSNLPGASLILYLNLLTHIWGRRIALWSGPRPLTPVFELQLYSLV